MFKLNEETVKPAKIAVVGVGGAGGNAVNRMIESGLDGVEFISTNTDLQALSASKAPQRVQIGADLTKGLGSGGDPDIGRKAMEESREEMAPMLEGADMVFITAGMGGGTGTGASPIIAGLARSCGALTVGVVTRPFDFEGPTRIDNATEGIEELKGKVDTLIIIPNQKLMGMVERETTIYDAFRTADDVLFHATKGVSDLVTVPGLINLDFADVRTIMGETGEALMGTGAGTGESRASEAAQHAISSPLLDDISIAGAKGVLLNITGSQDLTLYEVNEVAGFIAEAAGGKANIIFGAVQSKGQEGIRVTVIATGLGGRRRSDRLVEREAELQSHPAGELPLLRKKESQVAVQKGKGNPHSPEDLEIPTFLRRR